ncbi:MAG: hypothetical protein IPJ66_10255 [Bacteroidetes bacterium]|nr:hypothetical protein [Bacteroidota bacterium]
MCIETTSGKNASPIQAISLNVSPVVLQIILAVPGLLATILNFRGSAKYRRKPDYADMELRVKYLSSDEGKVSVQISDYLKAESSGVYCNSILKLNMDLSFYMEIKNKYGPKASWAVWNPIDQADTSVIEINEYNSTAFKNDFVIVGLNISKRHS